MRWKALTFLSKLKTQQKKGFRFCSRKCPPVVKELAAFEEDLRLMIKNVKFRKKQCISNKVIERHKDYST